MQDEKRYVNQIDEYFTIKNKVYDDQNFNEKRVDILKAQVHKQKRYIQNLETNLKLAHEFNQ